MIEHVKKGGKKHRKYGRQTKKPAQKRYTHERRWIKNKARKIRAYMRRHPKWKPYNLNPEVKALL